jgi:hypothetical protein
MKMDYVKRVRVCPRNNHPMMRNMMAMQVSFRKKQPKALLWRWGDSVLSTTDEGKRRCHIEQNP